LKLHRVQKNILDIFDHGLKKNYQISIIFDESIFDTTGHQMAI